MLTGMARFMCVIVALCMCAAAQTAPPVIYRPGGDVVAPRLIDRLEPMTTLVLVAASPMHLRSPDTAGVYLRLATIAIGNVDTVVNEVKAASAAGVAVQYRCFEGMIHSFFGLQAFDAARDAMDFVATELRRAFGTLDP